MIDCSIIIVNWNTAKLLRQCIKSIGAGCWVLGDSEKINKKVTITQPPARHASRACEDVAGRLSPITEIIVVDNGSTDGSVEMVKDYQKQNSRQFAKIRDDSFKIKLIENQTNLGFAKAVNLGIKQAQGETILLLNSDTRVKPDSLEKLIEFEKQVRPAIIGAKMLNVDGTVQGSCFFLPTVNRAISEYWLNKKKYFSKFAPESENPVDVEAVSGGAMLISKVVLDKIGNFDERYFMYFEDLDFCRRAKKQGFKVYYLPSAGIVHEHGASGKKLADSKDQWKRLIPSSKIYHGLLKHYAVNFIIRLGQMIRK